VDLHHASKPFVAHPKSSAVLAVLLIVIGIAFVSDWFPDSPTTAVISQGIIGLWPV